MTCTGVTCMGTESHEPRGRLARYLRTQYADGHAIKRLAREIDCTPKTAENILSGSWPSSRHWAAIARRFGNDVLNAVFAPEIDETVARLEQEVRDLETQLERKRAMARQVEGAVSRPARRAAPVLDRTARLNLEHMETETRR
ncbi:hypothetical protein IWC96_14570 [Brevundimonas sp. BAL450]|uniref:hypothetical protein n=1 Tax=Brevundimonas sp. BAL450 TaxID=1708162 RepID=UPI0018CAD370|nr:hypothetical protein [Brevundimonas sp. BAL450]MBG7616499.1 hypothetical protein [Brevundimonas sp. BAL450]